jgi:hypothetical protein
VECVFLLVALALLTLLIPILVKELPLLREQLPLQLQRLDAWLAPMLQHWGVQTRLDVASFKAFLMQHFDGSMDQVVTTLLSSLRMGGSMALTLIGNAVLIPVVLFYLLADWDRFVALLREWVPLRWRAPVDGFMIEADAVLGQYLRGQFSVMLALAIYYSLALRLCGLELALPIGVFTGLAIFIPYLGFGLGLLLALLAAVLQFEPLQALGVVALVYGAGHPARGVPPVPGGATDAHLLDEPGRRTTGQKPHHTSRNTWRADEPAQPESNPLDGRHWTHRLRHPDRRHAGAVGRSFGEKHRALRRVVMIGQLSRDLMNRHPGKAIAIEDFPRGLGPGHSTVGSHLGEFGIGGLQAVLRPQGD